MYNAKITGIASYVPDYVLTNDELSHMVDTNDEWITTRVGIKERRILKGEGLGSSHMGKIAVDKLLTSTGTNPDDIELVICATSNPDYRFPSTASIIAHKCGLNHCYAYDIQAACAGFIVALQAATAYVRSGMYKKVIVVAAEMMSSMTNYEDRTTCPLFGDAAAAILLEPTEEKNVGVIDGVFHVDGEGLPHLVMKAGGSAYPASHATIDAHEHFVYQEGRAVYKHAVTDMLTSSLEQTNEAYALAKISGLKYCEYLNRQYGTDYISVMPTNLYGPNDNYHPTHSHVLPALIRRFHEAKVNGQDSVTCWGDGTPLREFLYVDDLANLCVFLMNHYSGNETVNAGTGKEISIKDLTELVAKVVGYHGRIEWDTTKPNGTPRKLLDVSKATALGWRYRTELEDGIRLAYEDFLNNPIRAER